MVRQMATRNLILTAAIILALPFVNARAADLPSLDELLKQYKELGLPLPPKDAKLVRYESSISEGINGKLQEIKYFRLAFQIKPATETEGPFLLEGCGERRAWSSVKARQVSPEPSAADGVRISLSEALCTAAQFHSRGWSKLAQRILDISQKNEDGSPKELLLRQAWQYWEWQTSKPKIDRTPAAKHLKQILQSDKKLGTKEHRALLESLELALVPSKAKPGSIEALIDDLVDLNKEDESEFDDDYYSWQLNLRSMRILARGFEAVPALIEHIDDARLTRYIAGGGVNLGIWSMHYRVGDAVSYLLVGLVGRPVTDDWNTEDEGFTIDEAKLRKWFEEARKVGEERYVLEHVLFPIKESPGSAEINFYQAYLIQAKYPKHLPAIYKKALDSYPRSFPIFAQVVRDAKLPEKEKLDLLAYAAKNREVSQRWAALDILRKMNKRQFNISLPGAIELFPTDVGPWCGGGPDELRLARLAIFSDEAKVWQALEKVTRRAKVGLRVMLLDEFTDTDSDIPKRRERLQFLASFLNDPAVYDRKENGERNPNFQPYAYAKLEVRNFVALRLVDMLGIKIETNYHRTPDEWAKVRQQVQEALKRELDKAK